MKRSPLIALVALLTVATTAPAFTAPPSLFPFLPAQNVVVVVKIASVVPGVVDTYQVSFPDGTPYIVYSVTAGTPFAKVQALSSADLSFKKFKLATLTPAQRLDPLQVQAATIYFLNKVGRPFYGL